MTEEALEELAHQYILSCVKSKSHHHNKYDFKEGYKQALEDVCKWILAHPGYLNNGRIRSVNLYIEKLKREII